MVNKSPLINDAFERIIYASKEKETYLDLAVLYVNGSSDINSLMNLCKTSPSCHIIVNIAPRYSAFIAYL